MKKFLSFVAIALVLVACSSDDDNNQEAEASIEGTFVLVDFDSPFNDDYNNDGTTSSNLLDEVPCFANTITFDANDTYTSSATTLLIEFDGEETTAGCEGPFTETGTYEFDGSTLIINQETTTDPDGEVDIEFNNAITVVTSGSLTLTVDTGFGDAIFTYDRQ